MSVEESSHLGPDEAAKREQAERLLADIYDVVVLLVGAYAAKVLLKALNPYSPYPLPPDVLDHYLTELGIVHDSIMAWASEVERAVSQERRSNLEELGRQDAQVRAVLDNATLAVEKAGWRIATLRSDSSPAERKKVWSELGQAISALISASTDLMRLDAQHRAARVNEGRHQPKPQATANAVRKMPGEVSAGPAGPFGPKEPGGRPSSPRQRPGQRFAYDVGPYNGPKRQTGSTASRPPNQGPPAPGAR